MLGCNTIWSISSDEYSQRRKQFENLAPVNEFITGQQAKEYFTKSKLSNKVLCEIWNLADYDRDGKMNFHEFSIAMHLIKRSLEGVELPENLPKEMMVPPSNFTFPDVISPGIGVIGSANRVVPSYSELMSKESIGSISIEQKQQLPPPLPKRTPQYQPRCDAPEESNCDWAILQAVRPRYRLQFNQQDRMRRGYLTGEEAKAVLLRSGLPRSVLARIWQLADVDGDGRLTCEEFCVAMHLVEQARAGRALPLELPDSLIPPSMLRSTCVSTTTTDANAIEVAVGSSDSVSSPKEQHHPQQQKQRSHRNHHHHSINQHLHPQSQPQPQPQQENIQKHNHPVSPPTLRVAPNSPHVIYEQVYSTDPFNSPTTNRYKNDFEKTKMQTVLEERDKEKELLQKLKERQEFLIEALAAEEEKCQKFQERLSESRQYVEDRKAEIEKMRSERDRLVDSTAWLSEELEAARAEQGRCRRDIDSIQKSRQQQHGIGSTDVSQNSQSSLVPLPSDVPISSVPLTGDIELANREKQKRQQSIESLQQEISELEASISVKTQSCVDRNSKLYQLQQTVANQHIPEIEKLKNDVQTRRHEVHKLLEKRNECLTAAVEEKVSETLQEQEQEQLVVVNDQIAESSDLPNEVISESNVNGHILFNHNIGFSADTVEPVSSSAASSYVHSISATSTETTSATTDSSGIGSCGGGGGGGDGDGGAGDVDGVDDAKVVSPPPYLLEKYHAQHSFTGRQVDELTFSAGDTILVRADAPTNTPRGWLFGRLESGGLFGLFPEIYVKKLDIAISPCADIDTDMGLLSPDRENTLFNHTLPQGSTIKKAPSVTWVEAIYPWMMDADDVAPNQLSFKIGQRIKVLDKPSDDWWKGEIITTNNNGIEVTTTGWFPQIYVKSIDRKNGSLKGSGFNANIDNRDSSDDDGFSTTKYSNLSFAASCDISGARHGTTHSASSGGSSSSGEYCVVLYPYESSVPGDLTVHPGDVVHLLDDKPRGDWWKGRVRGAHQTGLFPAHYVRKLSKQELENTEMLSAITSDYYTSLSIENGSTDGTNRLVYDDIDQSTFQSANSPSSNDIEEQSENNQSSTYSNYCSLAEMSDTDQQQRLNTDYVISQNSPSPSASASQVQSAVNNHNHNHQKHQQLPRAIAVQDYEAKSTSEVSVSNGQEVVLIDTTVSDWYKVEFSIQGLLRSGWVPKEYFSSRIEIDEEIDPMTASGYDQCHYSPESTLNPPSPNQHSTSAGPTDGVIENNSGDSAGSSIPIGERLLAIYPYAAQNPDELSFSKHDLIQLVSKDEPDWWKGCNISAGCSNGLFPVNYVRRLDSNNSSDIELMQRLSAVVAPANSGGDQYSTVAGRPISWYIDGQVNFNALLTEDEKRRQFYIIELIETEKAYYDDLQEVHRVFYEPIKKSGILSGDELRHIFLNWTDLIAKSYSFYMALKIRQETAGVKQPIQCVGDILLSNFPNFIVYVRFCSMQNHAIVYLEKRKQKNPQFRELCDQCEQNLRYQKMPMNSYFLKPMQRITKYKLLVENILKHSEEGHPDRGDMEEAVAAARSLCEAVNEGIREKENSERLEWIQDHVSCGDSLAESLYFNSATNSLGHRKLVHSGTLFKAKSGKELVGFLFNDFLLLTTPQYNTSGCPFVFPLETSSSSKMQFKMYKKPILLNRVLIMTGVRSNQNSLSVTAATSVFGNISNNEIFTIREAGLDHVLKALSVNDRDKWVERLVAASLQYMEIENSVREISMSIRRSAGVGRLIVTILEGNNLRGTSQGEVKANAYCEASLGNQLRRTKVISSTFNPKWHCNMQFLIKNLELDILCLSVYGKDYFAPNEYLGRTEVAVKEIKKQRQRGPVERKLQLMGVPCGEIMVRFDIALFRNEG